jgi:hypothetical protein
VQPQSQAQARPQTAPIVDPVILMETCVGAKDPQKCREEVRQAEEARRAQQAREEAEKERWYKEAIERSQAEARKSLEKDRPKRAVAQPPEPEQPAPAPAANSAQGVPPRPR